MSFGLASAERDGMRYGTLMRVVILVVLCLVALVPGIAQLPPTDRDESRYVQATKQMVETDDYVDIRLQEVSRYKKPIGVYWFQAAYVNLSGQGADAPLWVYRLVSTTGGIAAVLMTFWAGTMLFGRRAGFLGAMATIGIVALNFESRIAKTDALLLATAVGAQAALGAVYIAHKRREVIGPWLPRVFWMAQGLGILVKGPITPLLSALTVATLLVFDRDRSWLRTLKPGQGLAIAALIAAPWLLLISWTAGMEFWRESVGNDLLGKVVEGQESHGAPPGYHFVLFSVFMWPFGLMVIDGTLKGMNRLKEDPRLLFLTAWFVPFWLFFELLPTKLPHYVLPAYPAMLLIMAWALTTPEARTIPLKRWQEWMRWLALAGAVAATVAFAAAAALAVPIIVGTVSWWGVVAALTVLVTGWLGIDRRLPLPPEQRVGAVTIGAAISFGILFAAVAPALRPVWLSPQIAESYEEMRLCPDVPLISAGYHEPSLVFLSGTRTRLINGTGAAKALLEDRACAVAVVNNHEMERFTTALPQGLDSVVELARIEGMNYSKGDRLDLVFYRAK